MSACSIPFSQSPGIQPRPPHQVKRPPASVCLCCFACSSPQPTVVQEENASTKACTLGDQQRWQSPTQPHLPLGIINCSPLYHDMPPDVIPAASQEAPMRTLH